MSWLASMNLDYEIVARERLTDRYRWHKAAWKAFPGIEMETGKNEKDRTPFLSRVNQHNRFVELLILSRLKPIRPEWCSDNSFRLSEIKPDFLSHDHYLFELYANPTRKVKKINPDGGFTKHGNRLAILDPEKQLEWLLRKALVSGFSLSSRLQPEIVPGDFHSFIKEKKRGLHVGVNFKGLLKVQDRELFTETFYHGIGSAKGFGFGMLVIKPIAI
jgi:CRISPR system Cascade subunit CasE